MTTQSLMREFLDWVEARPRTYHDVMDAWRTHCPRHMIWEDALAEGLVAFDGERVALSDKGRAALSRYGA
jgi:hypothetical protein